MTQTVHGVQLETARLLIGARDVSAAVSEVLQLVCLNYHWNWGGFWELRGVSRFLSLSNHYVSKGGDLRAFEGLSREAKLRRNEDFPGRVWEAGAPIVVPDLATTDFARGEVARRALLRSAIALPVVHDGIFWGVLEFFAWTPIAENDPYGQSLQFIADAIAIFISRSVAEELENRKS